MSDAQPTPTDTQPTTAKVPSQEVAGHGLDPIEPEKLMLQWEAPNRPFKKRDREYYTTIAVIVFLLSLILLFAGQFLPIAVVISVGFLSYVLASVPPEKITNAVTTYGIHTDKQFFFWDELGRYWYTTKFKEPLLHIETSRFPGRITLLMGNVDQDRLNTILKAYLVNEQPLPTFLDNAAEWLQEKIPLDKDEDEKVQPTKKKSS